MTHRAEVEEFTEGVRIGRIVCGRLVRLAVARHLRDLDAAGGRGFYFNEEMAEEACEFFPAVCRHSTGEWDGEPLELTSWQKFIIWCVFGWRRKSDDTRRFRKVYQSVGRKNGKTTLLSGLGLLLMQFDNPLEARAEIYCAATKEDQAKILFSEATRMVEKSPPLRKRITHKKGVSRLINESDHSFFRPIGSDSDSTDGFNPHGVLKDELHAWRERHRGLHEKLSTGGASRRQPLEWIITTAGDDRSQIWIEEQEYAVRVLESVLTGEVVDDRLFAFIASVDTQEHQCIDCIGDECSWCGGSGIVPPDDPLNEENTGDFGAYLESLAFERAMRKANPNLGISVKLEYLKEQANEAKQKPTARNSFLRYHCNIATSSVEKAIEAGLWAGCGAELEVVDGQRGFGAWDLGRSDDFASVAVLFPTETEQTDKEGRLLKRYDLKTWSWSCEESSVDWRREPFRTWRDKGLIEVHEGDAIDPNAVEDKIVELSKQYEIVTWAYDPTFSHMLAVRLLNLHGVPVFKFSQGARYYNECTRELLRIIPSQRLAHGNDPVLAWQAGNLAIRKDSKDQWMPEKLGDRSKKIDAMVASLMALSESMYHDGEEQPVFYTPGSLAL